MRGELKQLAWGLGALLVGSVIVGVSHGQGMLMNIGVGCVLLGILFLLFGVRDILCALLRRAGRDAAPGRVFIHLCAGLMLLLALAMFVDNNPRLGTMRWLLPIMLPASLYLLNGMLDGMVRLLEWMTKPKKPPRSQERRRRPGSRGGA
ncbi:hypothetical protein QPK32_10430 [Massilia sp. YIM B02763]|uniref:hypothetical protein n=1 Tax=Massilia sp. YIM B02763 TaxID=3050130 RepID=UPI0025B71EDE|nr:hypothetical protein [Massilia sp. YIM B02763]MDN4053496.1 hypothetical protein [Massilia sp. YIM B02763]